MDGRYLLVNQQYLEIFGIKRNEVIGRTDHDRFAPEVAEAFLENDRRVLETGAAIQMQEQAPQVDGVHTYVSVKFPLRDPAGKPYAIAGISTDITARVRAEQAREQISHQLQLILDSVGEGVFGLDCDGRTSFVNAAAADMIGVTPTQLVGLSQHELLHPVRIDGSPYADEDCPICAVLRDGDARQRTGDLLATARNDFFPTEYVCTPIREQDEITGAVVTFRDLTEQLHKQRIEREIQAAEAVQQRLYPAGPPSLHGLQLDGAAFPADVTCGDYYDYIRLADGSVVVAVGDVCGHGLGPALHMVETRAYLRALLNSGLSLENALVQLNILLEADMAEGSFLSLFLARIIPGDPDLHFAAAGHDARLLRADGTIEKLNSTGVVLGLSTFVPEPGRDRIRMESGDIIVIPTDGLTETMSPAQKLFGWKRVMDVVRENRQDSPRKLIERLEQAAAEFSQAENRRDDVTIVVLKVL